MPKNETPLFKIDRYRCLAAVITCTCLMTLSGCQASLAKLASEQADDPSRINEIDAATVQSIAVDSESSNLGSSLAPSSTACSLAIARTSCVGNAFSVLWSSCLLTSQTTTLVLSGGWSDAFDSNASCTSVQGGADMPNGGSVTRTAPSGFTVALTDGVGLVTDTNPHTTYTGLVLPTTGVSTSIASGTKTIVINGLHRILKSGGGSQLFEQSIVAQQLTVSGSLANGNRVVNGSLTTYHDSSSYTAVSSFHNLTWGSATCCFPTSGSISSVLSGSNTGTQSMTFTSVCGQVEFTNLSGTSVNTTLSYCM